jgi:hypothetical protein
MLKIWEGTGNVLWYNKKALSEEEEEEEIIFKKLGITTHFTPVGLVSSN